MNKDVYVEWLVPRKRNFAGKVLRVVLIALAAILWFFALGLGNLIIFALALLLSFATYFILLFTEVEYEYIYINGELMIDRILKRSARKRMLNISSSEIILVAPMTSPKVDIYKNGQYKVFDFTSGIEKDKKYIFEIYCNNGIKVIFEPNREMMEGMRSQMPHKVTIEG